MLSILIGRLWAQPRVNLRLRPLHVYIGVFLPSLRIYDGGQLHFNGWITLSTFDKFSRLIKIELSVNIFRNCYHLVGTDDSNDMHLFFIFANKLTRAIKGTLCRKSAHVKKLRGRWLVMKYSGLVSLKDGMQQVWRCFHYWRVHTPNVNNKPCLSSDKEKTCVVLASSSTEYKVNRMTKWYYQVALQNIQLPYSLFSMYISLLLTYFFMHRTNSWRRRRRNFSKVYIGEVLKEVFIFYHEWRWG
jgi:hypothetical protein